MVTYAFLGDLAVFLGDLGSLGDFSAVFLGSSTGLMLGITPPWAMVTPASSLPSSWSFLTASSRWRGMMRLFLLSLAALPASSSSSAARYSRTAAR
uniref:Uncharacterized protein n=1 Tax=Triticum urartu TaxID=4572 RepID=A0A8R7UUM6_TRIUA